MLSISNIYGHGYEAAQIDRLQSLGFTFREKVSTFAGAQILRFVDFPAGPALEFIEVEDDNAYLDFLPTGMVAYCPGVNLGVPPDAPGGLTPYQAKFQGWGANPRHVNYDGSETPGRPGWNYLNFDHPVVAGTFVYLGYADDPRPAKPPPGKHPNAVTHVSGIVFDLEAAELSKLAKLTEQDPIQGRIDLTDIQIWAAKSLPSQLSLPEKKFPLVVALLEAGNLDFFKERRDVEFIEFQSQPAVYIQTTGLSWDLIVST